MASSTAHGREGHIRAQEEKEGEEKSEAEEAEEERPTDRPTVTELSHF